MIRLPFGLLRLAAGGLGLVAVTILLVGCSEPDATTLRLGVAQAPVTLDPRFATDAVSERLVRLLYRSLIDFDADYRAVPSLAQWRAITPLHYSFVLDPQRAAFHDGSPVTAVDVKATYDDILNPTQASPHRSSLQVIDYIDVVTPARVDFHLKRPDPLFPGRLVFGILPSRLLAGGHDFKRAPLGSGPLEFVAWPADNRVTLKRRSDGQTIELFAASNATVRVLKLLRRELDIVQGDLPPELVHWLQRQRGIELLRERGTVFSYIGFNLEDPHVGLLRVRQAIASALDRQAIVATLMGGMARPASGVLPPEHWAAQPAQQERGRGLANARELLSAVGFDESQPLRLIYKTSSNTFRLRLATVIQSQLRDAGIQVEIQSHDWGTFYADVKAGRFQMYSLSWVGLKMPDIFRYAFHSTALPPHGANRGRYRNPRVDALIDAAERAAEHAEQQRLYRAVQAVLLRDLVYVPLWYEDHVAALAPGIDGYVLGRDGNYDGLLSVARAN